MNSTVCIFVRSLRWRLHGPGGNPWAFLLAAGCVCALSGLGFQTANAQDPEANRARVGTEIVPGESSEASAEPRTSFRPFVPEKKDYSFELGSMWERKAMYWMGAGLGYHLGHCIFSFSQTCQHYADLIAGVGGVDGQTNGMVLGGLRWQFVNFPSNVSPSVRLLAGVTNIRDDQRHRNVFTYGLGLSLTTSVHERVDLKIEARIGGGDQLWSQMFFSVNLKMEKWLDYFADRLKAFGIGAATMTGSAIGGVMDTVVGRPIQKAVKATSSLLKGDNPKATAPAAEAPAGDKSTEPVNK